MRWWWGVWASDVQFADGTLICVVSRMERGTRAILTSFFFWISHSSTSSIWNI